MDRRLFKNAGWTSESLDSWEEVWSHLWRAGVRWEWQNGDRYGRRRGTNEEGQPKWNLFSVYNDAYRLDNVSPLVNLATMREMLEWLDEERQYSKGERDSLPRRAAQVAFEALEGWLQANHTASPPNQREKR